LDWQIAFRAKPSQTHLFAIRHCPKIVHGAQMCNRSSDMIVA